MAYPAGAVYAWNGIPVRTRMPAVGETVNGQPFAVPGGAKMMTIHIPALTGAAATVLLQPLAPTETVEATQVWTAVQPVPSGLKRPPRPLPIARQRWGQCCPV